MLLLPQYFAVSICPYNQILIGWMMKSNDNDLYISDDWLEQIHEEVKGERLWASHGWQINNPRLLSRMLQSCCCRGVSRTASVAPSQASQNPVTSQKAKRMRDCAQAVCEALSMWTASRNILSAPAAPMQWRGSDKKRVDPLLAAGRRMLFSKADAESKPALNHESDDIRV